MRAQVQSALVRVHAAHLVLVDLITSRADAYRPILRLLALVRAGCRQCFAASRSATGEIVLLQGESRWTGALERALGVVAAMGARFHPLLALVDVAARYTVFFELETQMAGAVVTAWLVHATVLAAGKLSFVGAFVDICWKCIGKVKGCYRDRASIISFRKFEINIRKSYTRCSIYIFRYFFYLPCNFRPSSLNTKLRIYDSFLLNCDIANFFYFHCGNEKCFTNQCIRRFCSF